MLKPRGNIYGTMNEDLRGIIGRIGSDRVLFGSRMPFRYPEVSILKVTTLDISEEVRRKYLPKTPLSYGKI